MTEHRTFHYSMIEFRKNPADRAMGAIHLGVAIGFTTSDYRVLGLAVREPIESSLLDDLDSLSLRMIQNCGTILEHEIRAALQDEKTPDKVLLAVAARNPWSIHVAQPSEMVMPVGRADAESVERVAQDYVFTLYRDRLVSERPTIIVPAARQHSYDFTAGAHVDMTSEIPPAWMLPPKVWCLPNLTH